MTHARVGKWGNNLAVRLSGEIVRAARLRDGERVEIEANADMIFIRRTLPPVVLEDLFRSKTAEAWRALYAGAFDWGPDVGHESFEE